MKTIIKVALGVLLALFILGSIVTCVGGCWSLAFDDDNEVQTEEYEDDSAEDYYGEEGEDDEGEDMDDGYTNGNNVAPGEGNNGSAPSHWGDGTCRSINAKQFYQLVASKGRHDTYIGEGPCVVDFWADWCGYCKQIDPYLQSLAKKYKGKVQFYKVNADENEELTQLYGIDGLPTVFFCHDGDIKTTNGAYPQVEYDKMIQEML